MSTRRLLIGLLFVVASASGCCWCRHHHGCRYQPTESAPPPAISTLPTR